jgi:hypothetical protein
MNERIYKLAQEAGFSTWVLNPSKETLSDTPELLKKFAELMVRECMEQVWYTREDGINGNVSEVIKDRIKQHFGVE